MNRLVRLIYLFSFFQIWIFSFYFFYIKQMPLILFSWKITNYADSFWFIFSNKKFMYELTWLE